VTSPNQKLFNEMVADIVKDEMGQYLARAVFDLTQQGMDEATINEKINSPTFMARVGKDTEVTIRPRVEALAAKMGIALKLK